MRNAYGSYGRTRSDVTYSSPAQAENERTDTSDATLFLRKSFTASSLITATKIGASIWLITNNGGNVTVKLWHNIVPYLAYSIERDKFVTAMSWSTLAAVLVNVAIIANALGARLVRRRPARTPNAVRAGGLLTGCLSIVLLVATELAMQAFNGPYLRLPVAGAAYVIAVVAAIPALRWTRRARPVQSVRAWIDAPISSNAAPVDPTLANAA